MGRSGSGRSLPSTPPWTPPLRIVFGVATILSLFSTLQSYRLSALSISEPMDVVVWKTLVLNSFGYWYVPAALTPAIFALAYRFPIESVGRARTLLIYALGAIVFSLVHLACTMTVIVSLWPQPPIAFATRVQRIYLSNLDWALMTYCSHRRPQLCARLLPRVAGRVRSSGATRNAAGGGAAQDARSGAASALPVQHAARDFDADPPRSRVGRSDDQPPERSAPHHLRPARAQPE